MNNQKIGFGTAAIGRPLYINIRNQTPAAFDLASFRNNAFKILDSAYEQGIRYFDTAPGYGLAEQVLIEWVKNKKDESIEVATKWGYYYVADFNPNAITHEVKDHSIERLIKQWDVSKELLPFLSTLQIHSATFETGVLENESVLQKLAEIKSKHKIHIGITTTGDNQVDVLKKAIDIKVDGSPLFDVYQITYNIFDQSLLEVLSLIKESNSRIIIKEALANGRVLPNDQYPEYIELYKALGSMADKYAVGVDALALQFCIQTINPFMVLSGASSTAQIRQNLEANKFELSKEDLNQLLSFKRDAKDYWSERKQLQWN